MYSKMKIMNGHTPVKSVAYWTKNMIGQRKKRKTVSGRRDKSTIRAYELQYREQALLNLLETYPNQMLRKLAEQPEAEWHYGRLYLIGAITRDQYEAAFYLSKVTRSYEIMLQRYGHVRASGHEKFSSPTVEDLSLSAQKKFARAKKRYDEVYDILKACGKDVEGAIISTLRKDEKSSLELLRRGLTVLATTIG